MTRIITEAINLYGANREAWKCRNHEYIISGPADTGKTWGCLKKINLGCIKYAGARMLVVRQRQVDIRDSIVPTLKNKIINQDGYPCRPIGGENVFRFRYENGSIVVCAGLDNPGKALSAEYDWIYVNQAEQVKLAGWETLLTRANGRAGVISYPLVFGDCNPDTPKHWILQRAKAGKLKLFYAKHRDNPEIYDQATGELTPQGAIRMKILNNLTGVRRKRLLDGIWCGVEGTVYEEFDRSIHVVAPFEIHSDVPRYMVVDWGYRDPMVVQWWAKVGESYVMYREIYETGRIVDNVGTKAGELSRGERIQSIYTDHDPEKQARFEAAFNKSWRVECDKWADDAGEMQIPDEIYCVNAIKNISTGIEKVKLLLKVDPYNKPGIIFFDKALVNVDVNLLESYQPTCTVDEFDSYVWPEDRDGKPKKEIPVDKYNHGMDCVRYMAEEIFRMREGPGITA